MKKILIADDALAAREILSAMVKKSGTYEIVHAENGQVAVDKCNEALAAEKPFSLMFFDWNMPVLDGLEAIKMIRSNPQNDQCMIVMITANSDPSDIAKLKVAKVDLLVNKPISIDKIKPILAAFEKRA